MMYASSGRCLLLLSSLSSWMFGSVVVAFAPRTTRSLSPTTTTRLTMSMQQAPPAQPGQGPPAQIQFKLNPAETAVLFCKYQNDFATEGGKIYETVKEVMDATNMLENSQQFLQAARAAGVTVVHCPISLEPGRHELTTMPFGVVERIRAADALTFGTWGADICEAMTPAQSDFISPKYGMCAFLSTDLDNGLRGRGIKNVIVAGFLTNGSVESTIRTAYEKCYNVYVLTDCCAACSMAEHYFSIEQNFGMFGILTNAKEAAAALTRA